MLLETSRIYQKLYMAIEKSRIYWKIIIICIYKLYYKFVRKKIRMGCVCGSGGTAEWVGKSKAVVL